MVERLSMQIEVAGCPTTCLHCWAQGKHYDAIPTEDVAWIIEECQAFCADAGIEFGAYPMHEAVAHPDAAHLLPLFRDVNAVDGFQPWPTTGVPLATREDWQPIVEVLRSLGTETFVFALHGVDEVHDRFVARPGAFAETLLARERTAALGFKAFCNVFLTTESIPQIDTILGMREAFGATDVKFSSCWGPATYYPTQRVRFLNQFRPRLEDLLPIAEQVLACSPLGPAPWKDLEDYSEAAFVRKALDPSMEAEWPDPQSSWPSSRAQVVCRQDLEVFKGDAGLYGPRHGNLRTDGVATVLNHAINHAAYNYDWLFFSTDEIPTVPELARAVGDPQGQQIYLSTYSMRNRWLDLYLAEHRRY